MSALRPKADIQSSGWDVRFVPKANSCSAAKSLLFDHVVGAAEQRLGNCKAEHLGGLEINDHLDFRGLLNWQVGGLLTLGILPA